MSKLDDEHVRLTVYRMLAHTGRALSAAAVSAQLTSSVDAVIAPVRRWAGRRHLALAADSTVVMADPCADAATLPVGQDGLLTASSWVKGVAAFRIVVGGGLVVAPGAWSRPWTGPGVNTPVARLMARMFGIREVMLGVGALSSGDPQQAARWLTLGSIADAVDGAAVLAAWRHLPRATRYADVGMGFGAALANRVAARRLLDDAAHPS
jgi:hypothetical protein